MTSNLPPSTQLMTQARNCVQTVSNAERSLQTTPCHLSGHLFFTEITIHPVKPCISVVFTVFSESRSHHCSPVTEYFHYPRRKPLPLKRSLLRTPPPSHWPILSFSLCVSHTVWRFCVWLFPLCVFGWELVFLTSGCSILHGCRCQLRK